MQMPLPLRSDARAPTLPPPYYCEQLRCAMSQTACVRRQGYDLATRKRLRGIEHAEHMCASADGCWQGKALLADLGIWRWVRCCEGRCGGKHPAPKLGEGSL
jgi:hypothetical protein